MGKSLREVVESIVYAGMRPGVPPSQSRRMRWIGPFRAPLERFLSGGRSDDPFYLTNRTWGERVRLWVLLSVPCLLVAGLVALGVLGYIGKRDAPAKELTGAQIAARMLPDLNKPMDLNTSDNVELLEVRVTPDGAELEGSVRNRTDKAISRAELYFDLTDAHGSRLGAVTAWVAGIPPRGTASFRCPIQQHDARFALVRELHTE